jgi:group I intron endonuclease
MIMSIGIYKITSPSGKIYIGQSINVEIRKNQYKNFKSNKTNIGPKLYNSLQKYGFEKHQFEIIEECSLEQLNEREMYWGQYYNVLNESGLNLKIGESKGLCSEETKKKMSVAHKGNKKRLGCKMSDYSKSLIRIKNSKPKPKGFMSEEHKQKISQNSKGTIRNKNKTYRAKPIYQYDLQGNLLNEFQSAQEAGRYLGKSGNSIADCAAGRQKTAYGFIWEYKLQ